MKNRTWIIIFTSVIILCAAVYLFISNSFSNSCTVGIYKDGTLVEKINLNTVTAERKIKLSGDYGDNIISVSRNHIEMMSAGCPDKICVNHGELQAGGTPIVCLPNKIVICWENGSREYDVRTGESK